MQAKIIYNADWMPYREMAMLFMIKVPETCTISKKEDILFHIQDRYEDLIKEAIRDKWKPAHLIEDILWTPAWASLDSPKEMVQAILNSDQFATWKSRFLTGEEREGYELTYQEAVDLFENGTSLYSLLQAMSDVVCF